jgi:hypothetical protein
MDIKNLKNFKTQKEKEWAILNNIDSRPVCCVCGNEVKFKGIKNGFNETCSKKCAALNPKRNEKIIKTNLKKYGVKYFTQSKEYKIKSDQIKKEKGFRPGGFNTVEHKNAIKEKYGNEIENISQSQIIKEKIKKTFYERYGVDNPQKNPEIRNKTKETQIKLYGQDGFNPLKTKETLLEKYGVENPLHSHEIREKIKQTCQLKYGVDYPLQNSLIFEKCMLGQQKTAYGYKTYISPSGKIYKVRGYEGLIIDYLIKAGVKEDDITNLRNEIPKIEYVYENKTRLYYPNIFIKSRNILIDVKSTNTYSKESDKNLIKQNACKDLGYHHIMIIWDKKNNHIFEII